MHAQDFFFIRYNDTVICEKVITKDRYNRAKARAKNVKSQDVFSQLIYSNPTVGVPIKLLHNQKPGSVIGHSVIVSAYPGL